VRSIFFSGLYPVFLLFQLPGTLIIRCELPPLFLLFFRGFLISRPVARGHFCHHQYPPRPTRGRRLSFLYPFSGAPAARAVGGAPLLAPSVPLPRSPPLTHPFGYLFALAFVIRRTAGKISALTRGDIHRIRQLQRSHIFAFRRRA